MTILEKRSWIQTRFSNIPEIRMQTIARYELKYSVEPGIMDEIRRFISPYCVMDEHGSPEKDGFYTIDSLYFDDPSWRCFWDTQDQAPFRFKLRIRTYPDQVRNGIVKFEIKRRVHDLVIKSSAVVTAEGWAEWLCCRDIVNGLPPSDRTALESFITLSQVRNARPSMLVRYQRQAFRGIVDDYVRITFDARMQHQPMTRYQLTGWPDRWTSMDDEASMGAPSHVLIELKFQERAPVWLADLTRRFGLTRQGYSKYGSAVSRTLFDEGMLLDQASVMNPWPVGRRTAWTF